RSRHALGKASAKRKSCSDEGVPIVGPVVGSSAVGNGEVRMASVRRGARAVMRYFVPLYFVAIIVQIFLAGEGIFGIKAGPNLDDQKTLDAHRGFGFILADFGS